MCEQATHHPKEELDNKKRTRTEQYSCLVE